MKHQRLEKALQHLSENHLIRDRIVVQKCRNIKNGILQNGNGYINFSNNDYLGLSHHPAITKAFSKAAQKYGIGSSASAQVSGYTEAHEEVENAFAQWLNVDRAILFPSGYLANIGVISTLIHREDKIISDKNCHASIIDAIRLSRAKHYRYQHANLEHLNMLSHQHKANAIITESVFSTDGRIAPINDVASIANQHHAAFIIDDAHGIGVLGENARGVSEQFQLNQNQYSCLIMPLGKAFNAMGAIVAGTNTIIDYILQFCRTYRYATALPPALCSGILATLKTIKTESWRHKQLKENSQFFNDYAITKGLHLLSANNTAIKVIMTYDNENTLRLQNHLKIKGFYVSAFRPPSVPINKARIRISLNCHHTQSEIIQLIDHISKWIKQC